MKKKILKITVLTAAILSLTAVNAQANQGLSGQGIFGGRSNQDGSVNIRASTVEQYNPIRGQSVIDRPRPDFDPTPINLGSFQLFPVLNTGFYYDSNIYARTNNPTGDVVSKVNPGITAASNWGQHALAFTGFADINNYLYNGSESYIGGAVQADGRFDIAAQTWLSGKAGYQRDTEPRSSPSTPGGAAEPTQYDLYTGGIQAYRGVGQLKVKADYDLNYYDYDAVALVGGGLTSQSGRNRVENGVRGDVEYDVSENFKPFVRAGYNLRDYTSNSLRSSNGYNLDAGAKLDFGGITTMEAYAGYISRDYYNFLGDGETGALDFGGNLLWNVTELTSVQFEVNRTIEETTLGGVATPLAATSYIASGGSVTLTHELRRDILVEGNVSYTNDDYQKSIRDDDNWDFGLGSRYYFSRNFYGDLTYDYMKRVSNVNDAGYDRHVALVRLGAQY